MKCTVELEDGHEARALVYCPLGGYSHGWRYRVADGLRPQLGVLAQAAI